MDRLISLFGKSRMQSKHGTDVQNRGEEKRHDRRRNDL